jgi:hypothetical protein
LVQARPLRSAHERLILVLGIERGRQAVWVALRAIFKDLLISGLDPLEPERWPSRLFPEPAGERHGSFLVRNLVLGDVAVEIGGRSPRAAS